MPRKEPQPEFNEPVAFRPGMLYGRALDQLVKQHGESRNTIARNLGMLSLAGLAAADYADIARAAEAVKFLGVHETFAATCRALGPSCSRATGDRRKKLIERFTQEIQRTSEAMEDDSGTSHRDRCHGHRPPTQPIWRGDKRRR